jgi:hypothetical protein
VILWKRFQPFLNCYADSAGIIFGHVIAHELGHVLSRTDYHGVRGLMSAKWTETELRTMETKLLAFSPEEGAIIRSGMDDSPNPDPQKIAARPSPPVLPPGVPIRSFR